MAEQFVLPDPYHGVGVAGEVSTDYAPGFSNVKLSSDMPIMKAKLNSRKLDSRNAYHHKWLISISYNSLTRAEFNIIYPFLLYKKLTMQPFYVAIPPYYAQTLTGVTLNGYHYKGSSELALLGTMPTKEDIFTLNEKVYKVILVSGSTIEISPPLQEIGFEDTPLGFENPLFKVKYMSDASGYSLNDKGLYSFSLQLEETV